MRWGKSESLGSFETWAKKIKNKRPTKLRSLYTQSRGRGRNWAGRWSQLGGVNAGILIFCSYLCLKLGCCLLFKFTLSFCSFWQLHTKSAINAGCVKCCWICLIPRDFSRVCCQYLVRCYKSSCTQKIQTTEDEVVKAECGSSYNPNMEMPCPGQN